MDTRRLLNPLGVPVECVHRVWVSNLSYCTYETREVIIITETGNEYPPLCNRKTCTIEENQ